MTPHYINYEEISQDEYYSEYDDHDSISTWYNPIYWEVA